MAKEYLVAASHCNDETVIIIQADDAEIAVIKDLADRVTEASGYCCQPTMRVREATEADKRELVDE